jgi:hypothetical protein
MVHEGTLRTHIRRKRLHWRVMSLLAMQAQRGDTRIAVPSTA